MERSPYVITAIMDAGPHLTTIEILWLREATGVNHAKACRYGL